MIEIYITIGALAPALRSKGASNVWIYGNASRCKEIECPEKEKP